LTVITCPKCEATEDDVEIIRTFYPSDFGIDLPRGYHVHAAKCKKCNSYIYSSSDGYESYEVLMSSYEEIVEWAKEYFRCTKEWLDEQFDEW